MMTINAWMLLGLLALQPPEAGAGAGEAGVVPPAESTEALGSDAPSPPDSTPTQVEGSVESGEAEPAAVPAPSLAPEPAPAPEAAPTSAPAPAPEPAPAQKQPALTYEVPNDPSKVHDGGVKWTFGAQGQNSLRMLTWHQLWLRYTETNPGSQVQGKDKPHEFDIGIRRSRMLFVGQITDRFQIVTHIGINNQTFNNARKPQIFVHEATAQVRAWKEYLYVGAGLHYWHGISRLTNASTLNFLGLDAPIMNWPTIERTDQFARHLGVYAKGKIGRFDYRVALNKPFSTGTGAPEEVPLVNVATDNPRASTIGAAGYFMFQFLDQESNTLPYMVGSYLGTKKVVNLGAGFQWHRQGSWWEAEDGERFVQDVVHIGADLFVDLPAPKQRGAATFYGAYYYYDFGPDYLRMVGIMNVATGGTSLNGPGNAVPTIGTGHHGFAEFGYMLPYRRMKLHRLQPYVLSQVSAFEALDQITWIPEAGLNWHLLGHHFKLTAAYRSRPIYVEEDGRKIVGSRRSEVILQAHVYF